jgi:hypothetical protein
MTFCKSWKKYQGIRPPKCRKGHPCDACKKTYKEGPRWKEDR